MRSIGMVMAILCFLVPVAAFAVDLEDSAAGKKISISGNVEVETAELVKARSSTGGASPGGGEEVSHIWYGHTIGTLNLSSNPTEYFAVHSSFEFRQYMTMLPINVPNLAPRDIIFGNTYWNEFYIREFQGIFSLFKDETLAIELALGYMPYKYNPEVRNLGEYLFRSGTYPLFLINEFDRPFARLTGLRVGVKYTGEMVDAKLDAMGLVEREFRPYNDVSLAAVGDVNILKLVDIGGGVEFARSIPMDSRITTFQAGNNRYIVYNYDSTNNDTGYYTFKGTKLMARATIDLAEMVSKLTGQNRSEESLLNDIVGKNGGKIYGEYAIIGLQNYPADPSNNPLGYTSMAQRSPWMVGFNVPMWKILDECTVEFERWPGYQPDNYYTTIFSYIPVPTKINNGIQPGTYDSTVYVPHWNWSVYMKKQLFKHFAVVCEMGHDHQRWESNPGEGLFYDLEAAFVRHDEWGWHLSGVFSF